MHWVRWKDGGVGIVSGGGGGAAAVGKSQIHYIFFVSSLLLQRRVDSQWRWGAVFLFVCFSLSERLLSLGVLGVCWNVWVVDD